MRSWLPLCLMFAACARPSAHAPASSAADSKPARAAAEPPIVLLSDQERKSEVDWLSSFGLKAPKGGVLLAEPFKLPLTRRSFIVPTAWYRAQSPTTVVPADLAADLDLLAVAFERVYGGYERARARGFDFDAWLARWKERLRAAGDGPIPAAEAFAPLRELMAAQLDNHTGAILDPYVSFGSGSRTALLARMPAEPCTRMRTTAGVEIDLDPRDPAQRPRQALVYRGPGRRLERAPHLVFPRARGELAAVQCGAGWIDALPPDKATEKERKADLLGLLGRAGPDDDAPAYTTLAPDVGYLRLPTFTKRTSETLRSMPATLPAGAGRERAIVIDLRFNDGGDGGSAFAVLARWIDMAALEPIELARTEKNSCLVDALQWGYTQMTMRRMEPPLSNELRAILQRMLDTLDRPVEKDCPVSFAETPGNWSYDKRGFKPAADRPVILVLVNEECGSDCEWVASVLATRPETVMVGVNTFGVAEFVQPSYMVLPRTRVIFRMARGMSNPYSDGRSLDGYGLDVDLLVTSRQAHSKAALVKLARALAKSRALSPPPRP